MIQVAGWAGGQQLIARAYVSDLHERVVAMTRNDHGCREMARTFHISLASMVRWLQLFRASGGVAPRPHSIRRRSVMLPDRGVRVSYGAVWAFVATEGVTVKKSLHACEQERPDVARKRIRWKRYQKSIDPTRLVFIDG